MTLPKHYNPTITEPRWERFWQEHRIFHFDTESEAFNKDGFFEVIRILDNIRKRICEGESRGDICDKNKNTIGRFDLLIK